MMISYGSSDRKRRLRTDGKTVLHWRWRLTAIVRGEHLSYLIQLPRSVAPIYVEHATLYRHRELAQAFLDRQGITLTEHELRALYGAEPMPDGRPRYGRLCEMAWLARKLAREAKS